MKYKLKEMSKNNYTDIENVINNILKANGINDTYTYLNPTKKCEYSYSLLDNMDLAVKCLLNHINNKDAIQVIVDPDADGNMSASALINYLKDSFEDMNISWAIHTGKQHGITDDINISNDIKLLIVPDAGSNDYDKCKELKEKGIDVIVIDHHEAPKISENAIVINNQLCNYPNKSLCGVGVIYKFLQALDEELWQSKADNYLDLVAIGEIGDSMDITNLETKYYINKGLENIQNKQLKAMFKKQEYSTKGLININNVAFYITPLINAMIRVGKQDEKELMFKGFLEEYEEFDYKPRGDKPIEKEDIYTRVARLCTNAKSRQDKLRDKALTEIEEIIYNKDKLNDKVIVINCNNKYNLNLTGVIAMKISDKFNRPCILLNKSKDGRYRGSGRNTDRNDVKDLKYLLNSTGIIEGIGHTQAMGVNINDSVPQAINKINELLQDVEFNDDTYEVYFVIPFEDLEDELIFQIDLSKSIWGKGLEEPLIAIKNVEIKSSEIEVMGKKANTLKLTIDGVEFIKFNVDNTDELIKQTSDWEDETDKVFTLDIVGSCSSNEWNGEKKPQIKIKNYNIVNIK